MTIKKIREESVESHETSIVQLAAFVEGMGLQSFGGLIDANSVWGLEKHYQFHSQKFLLAHSND